MDNINLITVPADEWNEVKANISNIISMLTAQSTAKQKEFLTSREVMNILDIGRTTLDRWILNGTLTKVRINNQKGSKIYFRASDIERLKTENPA